MSLPTQNDCVGCAACVAICPQQALRLFVNQEGFLCPGLDKSKCNHCGLCEASCPVLQPAPPRQPISCFAAINADRDARMKSSSGGVFQLLANLYLENHNAVAGAAWDADFNLQHKLVQNQPELIKLLGSKYLQSDFSRLFEQIEPLLNLQQKALICGTPCQIAALRSYFKAKSKYQQLAEKKLLLIDFICHGVPSPLIFKLYKEELENNHQTKIKDFFFRNKTRGWKNFSLKVNFENNEYYSIPFQQAPYMQGFLNELFNRPSCHRCQFRNLRSGSDLTLGDYWGVEQSFPDLSDDLGVSVVLVNSEKGLNAWRNIQAKLQCAYPAKYNDIIAKNPSLLKNLLPHPRRKQFFKRLLRAKSIEGHIKKHLSPSLASNFKTKLQKRLQQFKRLTKHFIRL